MRDPSVRTRKSDRSFRQQVSDLLARYRIHVRENWYRDVWLFIVSTWVLYAQILGTNASHQAHLTAIAIQQERAGTVRRGCQQQNARHVNTLKQLHKEFAYYRLHLPTGQTQASLKLSLQNTTLLIDALVPRQNCAVVVRAATTPSHEKGGHHHA